MRKIKSVPILKGYLETLRILTDYRKPPIWQIRSKRQEVAYIMGDESGLGFGLVQ